MKHRKTIAETKKLLQRDWGDYPLTILVINPINRYLVRHVAETRFTPNQLSLLSFFLMVAAAFCMSAGHRVLQALAGCLVLLGYLIDCLDGDLARYSNMKSPLGAMLDPMLDRYGEFLMIFGAAVCGWNLTENISWLMGGIYLTGMTLIYFYLVDAMVWKVPPKDESRKKEPFLLLGTKVRFGVIEPFMWGLAGLSFLGKAHWSIVVFGIMFTAANMICVYRLVKRSKQIQTDDAGHYGTHSR